MTNSITEHILEKTLSISHY